MGVEKRVGKGLRAAALGTALLAGDGTVEAREEKVAAHDVECRPRYYLDPEYFRQVPNGKFPAAESKRRLKHFPHGETVWHDVGVTFYLVQKGDTIEKIRQKLGRYKEYEFLLEQTYELSSFNNLSGSLKIGMRIPIPWPDEKRELSNDRFIKETLSAIHEMKKNEAYGQAVMAMIKKAGGIESLAATMLAVAKQESGGAPLGQFEFHRYEPGHEVFSYSIFHVLMEGPGLTARRTLNLTEGQLYHPRNATKLFLAFMIEKCHEYVDSEKQYWDPQEFFPLDKHPRAFAAFYNGSNWEETNPNYAENIVQYYNEAAKMIEKLGTKKK